MIPNMGDFIYICDSAYDVHELMAMEVDMLNTLQLKLHVPTCHDALLPMLVEIGEALPYPDGAPQSQLRNWCDCLTLLGQANYSVVLHDPSTLARCVATLGALLSRGVARNVAQEDGSTAEGTLGGRLRDRVCFLKTDADWDCLRDLVKGVDAAVKDSREMIVKCHADFVALRPLQTVLEDLAQHPKRQANHLKAKDVRPALDKYYAAERCKETDTFLDKEGTPAEKKAYMRRGTGGAAEFNIVSVTCALGRQLLHERGAAAKSVVTRSSAATAQR